MAVKKEMNDVFEFNVTAGNTMKSALAGSQNAYLTYEVPQGRKVTVCLTVNMVEEDA